MLILRALLIAHTSAIVVSASTTDCYPPYVSGRRYAIGDWISASVVSSVSPISYTACSPPGVDDCPTSGLKREGGLNNISEMFNFQCILDETCSSDAYAPGSMNSGKAWTREMSPCSSSVMENAALHMDQSSTKAISRKLQETTTPTTSLPTSVPATAAPTPTTAVPTAIPTTALPTTLKPTLVPTTIGPTSLKPTATPTTTQPTAARGTNSPTTAKPVSAPTTASPTTLIPTPNPAATSIPTSVPTSSGPTSHVPTSIPTASHGPTSVPTSAKPFTIRPTRKPHHVYPRPPNQCLCRCGSKASKHAKSKAKAAKTRRVHYTTTGKKYCTCPCVPVPPICYRCRPHMNFSRTNNRNTT